MRILVINAGSSSLKYQLFDMDKSVVMAKGICERIGIDGRIKHSAMGKDAYEKDTSMVNHAEAVRAVIGLLTGAETGVIADMGEIDAIGHRVVHGGEFFSESVPVDESVIHAIEECIPLSPLHNPANLVGIRACAEVMPGVPQVAVFDTAFHKTMPKTAYLYALPYDYYQRLKVRRYGFHGTSHRYVSHRAMKLMGDPSSDLKIITCHMGNGSSLAAVKGGVCLDTSMGFTPLEGVPMGTRSGNIDPAILEYIMEKDNLTISQMTEILSKNSGVLGISDLSSDFRDLMNVYDDNPLAKLALDIFSYQIKKTVGAFAAAIGGCDALVFTAGIGENNAFIREKVCEGLSFMGLILDRDKNSAAHGECLVSTDDSPSKIWVIPTNEEWMIALDTRDIVGRR